MQFPFYSPQRGLKAGAIGGIIGALVLGLLAAMSSFILDQEAFYVTIARRLTALVSLWLIRRSVEPQITR